MIKFIEFSDDFNAFLASLSDKTREDLIIDTLNGFAKGETDLDQKACEHFEDRNKAAICDANVVVYYDIHGDTMRMINGSEFKPRVA